MEDILFLPIFVPIITGLIALIFGKSGDWFTKLIIFVGLFFQFIISIKIFISGDLSTYYFWLKSLNIDWTLRTDAISRFILIFIALFSFLIALFSFKNIKNRIGEYYFYLCLTVASASGAILANDLIVMMVF